MSSHTDPLIEFVSTTPVPTLDDVQALLSKRFAFSVYEILRQKTTEAKAEDLRRQHGQSGAQVGPCKVHEAVDFGDEFKDAWPSQVEAVLKSITEHLAMHPSTTVSEIQAMVLHHVKVVDRWCDPETDSLE